MARFIEIGEIIGDHKHRSLAGIGAINYIFNYEGLAVIKTTKGFVITNNSYEVFKGLLAPYQFNETEINGTLLQVAELNTKNRPIKTIINLNKISSHYGGHHGVIQFEDGSSVESTFSPQASMNKLKLDQGDYILRHNKEE
ncbi:hypothetical protein [Paenibacillus sp. FSL H3-0457]|uniref:hypothetical protein n=1 Tax=Paenibacillus sp. FSL H3-0457 TaxID=2921430 RepID=UPI0030EDBC0E